MDTLLSWFPHVVVADVTELVAKEEATLVPGIAGPPVAVFSLSVQQVVSSDIISMGSKINLHQGDIGETGSVPDYGLPSVGPRYVFFLQDAEWLPGTDDFVGAPFARFVVLDSGRVQPNGWEAHAAGLAAVSGVTAEQAREALQQTDPEGALQALSVRTVEELTPIIQEVAARVTPVPTLTAASPTAQ